MMPTVNPYERRIAQEVSRRSYEGTVQGTRKRVAPKD
jgi:hypothetical protein